MGTAAVKQSDEQSYVPPEEEKQTITHIDFDDDSDGDDEMDTQRREVRHKFASSDSAGRMALERLRSQESQQSSRLTNDEENLEQIEASFIKMTMTPSPQRSKPKKKRLQTLRTRHAARGREGVRFPQQRLSAAHRQKRVIVKNRKNSARRRRGGEIAIFVRTSRHYRC